MSLKSLHKRKSSGEKITCLTAYDATFAHLLSTEGVDILLVGDSLGMVLQGHDSTLPVTIEQLAYHVECVHRGNQGSFLIADMPFATYPTPELALANATTLMRAGANMVKLEGGIWLKEIVQQLTQNGIPVCGHLGLTPQSVNVLGGYRVQGQTEAQAHKIIQGAQELQEAGIQLLVLECVPSMLAHEITKLLAIPTIGIGAGPECDGQVLVLHDMLGITPGYSPKFCKNFLEGTIQNAIHSYVEAVKLKQFPAKEHCF